MPNIFVKECHRNVTKASASDFYLMQKFFVAFSAKLFFELTNVHYFIIELLNNYWLIYIDLIFNIKPVGNNLITKRCTIFLTNHLYYEVIIALVMYSFCNWWLITLTDCSIVKYIIVEMVGKMSFFYNSN